jgi:hypothetical protein
MNYCPICHHLLVGSKNNRYSEFCFFENHSEISHSCRIYNKNNQIIDYFIEITNKDNDIQFYVETYFDTNQTFVYYKQDLVPFQTEAVQLCDVLETLVRINKLRLFS